MVVVYLVYTYKATEWRISIRKPMNESDTDANTKAVELAPQLRDGEIFRRRGARDGALRPLDGALRARLDADLHLARGAQFRTGGDLHHRHDGGDGARRPRHRARRCHDRRLRPRQRDAGAALHPVELHGHALPRDQAGADRHRRHVPILEPQPGDRGPARRDAARRQRGRACASRTCTSPTSRSARS